MTEGRTNKSIRNITYNFFSQILTMLLSFVSRTVFLWVFGVEYLGLNGLFSDVLTLLSFAGLGFNSAMVYNFYKPLADGDYDKLAALTSFYKKIYLTIALLVSIIGLLLIPFLPFLINLEEDIPYINVFYILALSDVVISYLFIYKTSILTADQKGYKITGVSMATSIVKTLIQVLIMILTKNYILYLAIGPVFSLINNIIVTKIAVKEYTFINKKGSLTKIEKKSIWNTMYSVFIYKVSSVLLNATDNILISVIISTAAVGYYSNYLMLQNKLSMFYTIIFTSMTASIGNLIFTEKPEKRFEVFKCQQSISFIISGVAIPCYIVLVNDFIKVWLGETFVLSSIVVYAVGLNMYLSCVMQPLWSYREATGLYRKTKWVMVYCTIINLVLSVVLGKLIGLAGILFASGLARLSTYVWLEPKILYKDYFEKKPWGYYVSLLKNSVLIVILVFVNLMLSQFANVTSFFEWFIKAVITFLICVITIVLFYKNSDGVKVFISKFRQLLVSKN